MPCMNLIFGLVAVLKRIRHRNFTESMRLMQIVRSDLLSYNRRPWSELFGVIPIVEMVPVLHRFGTPIDGEAPRL